jgi:hypothetical protein
MTSACHECLIMLFNEWSAFGNVLLPRDLLIDFCDKAIQNADESEERKESRMFSNMWKSGSRQFKLVKKQYERMLKHLPQTYAEQWKERVGIAGEIVPSNDDSGKKDQGETGEEVTETMDVSEE